MNWKTAKISEVAKEQIWKEHVKNESNYMNWKESFSINPYRLDKTKPVTDSIAKRSKRFLCKEKALLASIQSQLGALNGTADGAADAHTGDDTAKSADATSHDDRLQKTAECIKDSLLAIHKTPVQKYRHPMTESQEVGWISRPLLTPNPEYDHSLRSCDITRFVGDCKFQPG